jgi:hypothetical protein
MRKVLFAAVASSVVLAVAPATALARDHHRRGHHHAHRTHSRARDEHFGNPNDRNPAPGVARSAGTVASFNNGLLMITSNDGSMVSGQVTGATEIRCEQAEPEEMNHRLHVDGDHGGGGDNSDGGDNGGDHNGQNDDQGENEAMCSTANLVTGTIVRDAELTLSGAGAIWKEVELAGQNH